MFKPFLYIAVLLAFAGCTKNNNTAMEDIHKVYGSDIGDMRTALESLSAKKIYFGHQSVGYDILSGLKEWEEETGVHLKIAESRDFSSTEESSLVHFRVGENRDPYSKIDDFAAMVQQIPKDEPSVAFFKFCYIDFQHSADVDAIFKAYREKMVALKESSGNCEIMLCTVPVTTTQKGLKAIAKKILGKPLNNVRENIIRNAFSDRIRAELGDKFTIFDLAKVESTLPDGSTETYKYKGEYYPRLPERYTRDKGHLNSFGAKIVAYNFVAFLTEEMDRK